MYRQKEKWLLLYVSDDYSYGWTIGRTYTVNERGYMVDDSGDSRLSMEVYKYLQDDYKFKRVCPEYVIGGE